MLTMMVLVLFQIPASHCVTVPALDSPSIIPIVMMLMHSLIPLRLKAAMPLMTIVMELLMMD